MDDDWGNDLELPSNASEGLKLKTPKPRTPVEEQDDDFDWGEGSLGIRFAGTRQGTRGARSSSISAMSPSLGSIMTMESEEDDLGGLVLPTEAMDFGARLEKLKKAEQPPAHEASLLPPLPLREQPTAPMSPTSAPMQEPPQSPIAAPLSPSPFSSPPRPIAPRPTAPKHHHPRSPQSKRKTLRTLSTLAMATSWTDRS